LEKKAGLSVSMYCDRDTTDIAKSQQGFLLNVAQPIFGALNDYLKAERIEIS
jgi:hypothetical protein